MVPPPHPALGDVDYKLPTTEQQRHLPSASAETEPHAPIVVVFPQPLRKFRMK